ncbi:hypothetical protein IU500_19175 [Nocardia terpenica]|uniref:hypothetical protein n=1 Tax=Nocardia terpenica TaxID=455432 RepID=UPI0018953D7C|nr:hypothetical protein [Nocardia terpenica]MBF6062038.1 hypothetical protein [Nocardia terpenica]MBF6106162.1 hypothetical protein [Nocardia terpenica]MBF6110458.1 hypothetical protein [Nocardia terpenica]MBF6120705.1 hypothetical protein [Nocardia terpenica]MBF6151794.1 hypothetical protein [Nocardia terpenica]
MVSGATVPLATTGPGAPCPMFPAMPVDVMLPDPPTPLAPLVSAPTPVPAQLALIGLLRARIGDLAAEVRQLRRHNRCLIAALDDCLDREAGHALCAHNERLALLPRHSSKPVPYRSVSRCNGRYPAAVGYGVGGALS